MKIKLFTITFILLFILISCSNGEQNIAESSQSESIISKTEKDKISEKSEKSIIDISDTKSYIQVTFLPDSIARYLITEQLATLDFPIDAIGETNEINGSINFDKDGKIIKDTSTIIVNVSSLKSDSGRRDRYISRRSLESDKYPEAVINVKKINDLPWPLPNNGSYEIEIIGDMLVHGVTDEVAWKTIVNFEKNKLSGISKTNFGFEKFNMDLPRVAIVLSVENNIRLELEFSAEISKH